MKVLVADDSRFMRKLISKVVRKAGHTVVCEAQDGEEALIKIEECKPHLVILDINMPKMNGLVVLKKARDREVDVKFIILTALDQPWVLDEITKLGVRHFITKPLKPQELLKVIKDVEREDY